MTTLSDMTGELTFTIRLSATPRGARLARRLTVQQLMDWQRPFETAEHLAAELANNAITHGRVQGRGLLLIDALADGWGATLGPPPTKTVWAELDVSK